MPSSSSSDGKNGRKLDSPIPEIRLETKTTQKVRRQPGMPAAIVRAGEDGKRGASTQPPFAHLSVLRGETDRIRSSTAKDAENAKEERHAAPPPAPGCLTRAPRWPSAASRTRARASGTRRPGSDRRRARAAPRSA